MDRLQYTPKFTWYTVYKITCLNHLCAVHIIKRVCVLETKISDSHQAEMEII